MNESPPVIRLANGDGSLEIALAGWQCPGKTSGDGAYCVNVDGKVRHDRGDWQFHGRFCRISHLWCLADWLDAVAANRHRRIRDRHCRVLLGLLQVPEYEHKGKYE